MSDYVPIDCDQHSRLELLAMRRAEVVVEACDESGSGLTYRGRIVDVQTRDGAEYLLVDDSVNRFKLRLDHLAVIRSPAGALLWSQKIAE